MSQRAASHHLLLLAAGALIAAALLAFVPARADAYNCRASAFRATVLTAPAVEPAVANPEGGNCVRARGPVPEESPSPALSVSGVVARTDAQGEGPGESVSAIGGLSNVRIGSLGSLGIPVPQPDLSRLAAVPVILPGGPITVDARAAAQSLVSGLPNGNVLELSAALASVRGRCANGTPTLTGVSQTTGLRIFGQLTAANEFVERSLNLANSADVDPGRIDPRAVPLPAGVTPSDQVFAAIEAALEAIPPIAIPERIATVRVTPNQQERVGDRLTQRALRVQVSLGGTPVADLGIGEATVSTADANCTVAAAPQMEMQCQTRRIVLTDVVQRGRRVQITGTADRRRFAGQRVTIRFTAGRGRVVARPTVQPDGSFAATAPLPPRGIRRTNRARYQAQIGREKSLELKLFRRMLISRITAEGGRLTLTGRLTRPLSRPLQRITIQRRISCTRGFQRVRSFMPRRNGTFRVTFPSPPAEQRATYRLESRVRATRRNPKLFPTFTLPKFIDLARGSSA